MPRLLAAIVIAMIARPTGAADVATSTCSPIERTATQLGPTRPPVSVDLYLDPVHGDALPTWLELRRLVHDQKGEVGVRAHVVRGADMRDRRVHDRVRAWVLAAAAHDKLLPALRVLARQGPDRVYARLMTKDARASLAREIELEPSVLTRELASGCAPARLEEATDAFARLLENAGHVPRETPIFVIDHETVLEDASGLQRLRPELSYRDVTRRTTGSFPIPKAEGRSPLMVRPAIAGGIKLGGPALPHRMLIFASGEQDPAMQAHLAAVLSFRAANPGVLSVHLVARGRSPRAQRLAERLCAARDLGRELDYARYLAALRPAPRTPTAPDVDLLRELEAAAARGCASGSEERGAVDEAAGRREGLRDGPWLDGTLRTGSDLDRLERTLRLLEAAHRPLGTLLSPPSSDEP